jgi:carotenoid cleavage dioxygenase
MPRAGGALRWFEVEPIFYSHTLNAYDDAGSVVIDLTTLPAPFYAAGRGSDGPAAVGPPSLDRWTIDLKHGRVRRHRLDDRPQEFPRVNEALVSRRHRYGYTAAAAELFWAYGGLDGVPPDQAFTNALIKHDLVRGTREIHRFPPDAAASEAVFVPAEQASRTTAEDDGYTLAYVHNPDRGAADLVILAAVPGVDAGRSRRLLVRPAGSKRRHRWPGRGVGRSTDPAPSPWSPAGCLIRG